VTSSGCALALLGAASARCVGPPLPCSECEQQVLLDVHFLHGIVSDDNVCTCPARTPPSCGQLVPALCVSHVVNMCSYPNFIAPMFNKFTPLEAGPLRSRLEALAERLNFPLRKLFVVDGSRRSAHSNAYMCVRGGARAEHDHSPPVRPAALTLSIVPVVRYGFCNNKRIVLYDTLLKQANPAEVRGRKQQRRAKHQRHTAMLTLRSLCCAVLCCVVLCVLGYVPPD